MKKFINCMFIFSFLLLLFLPIIKFNKDGMVSKKENRNLAELPIMFKNGHFNLDFFSEYDNYFADRFGGRNKLIAIDNIIQHAIMKGNYFNEKAVMGKNGWLFYISEKDGNNLADYRKDNLLTYKELSSFKNKVNETITWCRDNNIPCIFLICPNKHSIYPENYPFDRPDGITRADQLISVLKSLNAAFVFSRDFIFLQKNNYNFPLYYETDTHWNQMGAYLSFKELKEKLHVFFKDTPFPDINYKSKISYNMNNGDLLSMLNLTNLKCTYVNLSPIDLKNDFYIYLKNEGRKGVHTCGKDTSLPRALVFRDSFFTALEPFVSPLFRETEYLWKYFGEEDKGFVLQYKPDIIIFECVERHFPSIIK